MKLKGLRGPPNIPSIRITAGVYFTKREDGTITARARPKQPYTHEGCADYNRALMQYSAYLIGLALPVEMQAALDWQVNSNDTWKDALTRAQFGTLIRLMDVDGDDLHPADHSCTAPPEPLPPMAGFQVLQTTNFTTGVGVANDTVALPSNTNEVICVFRNIGAAAGAQRCIRVSVDGGATYFSASGDYVFWPTTGLETNVSAFVFSAASGTAQQSGATWFPNMNVGGGLCINTNFGYAGLSGMFLASASPITHMRFLNVPSSNLTGTTGSSFISWLGR